MGFLDSFSLSRSTKRSDASEPKRTPVAVAQRIQNILGVRELDAMPVQAARAFQLASDPNSTAADFINVIEADEALSSRVIRIANSVYFFRGTAANDIEKAVGNIGLDELRCLLSATLLRSMVQGQGAAREQVWANSVATAVCARLLSRFADSIGTGEAFLCGLVHDVGKLVMIRRGRTLYDKVFQILGAEDISVPEAEEKVFELNHVEVGKWVAEKWSFPRSAVLTIAHHHDAWPKEPVERRDLSVPLLVKVADTIAHSCGIGHPTHLRSLARRATEQLPVAFEQFRMSIEEGEQFIETFKKQFEAEFGLYQLESH